MDAATADTSRGPITIWYSNNVQEVAWGEQMVAAWNDAHPDEPVRAQQIPAGTTSEAVITAAITAGNAPCLIFNTSPAAVPEFARQQGLVDLDTLPPTPDGQDATAYITARSGDLAAQYASSDGDFRQIPWKSNPVMVLYDRKAFTAAGLDPDDPPLGTYDELLATSRALVSSGAAPNALYPSPSSQFFQSWFDFYPFYAAETGGTQLVEDGRPTFDDADGRAVWDLWRTLYAEGLANPELYNGDAFADGATAMTLAGPWAVAVYDGTVDWGAVPVPTSDGTPADETWSVSDAKNIALYSACTNRATAWDLARFATSPDQDRALLEMTGQMPLRADLLDTYADWFADNPAYVPFAEQAARTVEVPNVESSTKLWQAFRNAWSSAVVFRSESVQEGLDEAAGAVRSLLTGGQR
ncbi:extracellular solute-binding protein [uncultured Pseudokineococcus sp.]|uniref:extracellular solute-binding protein n=1 Tax=uncultured Pseudokineococcus sp. TaxID=1642928 RepID=UPI002617CD1A|nr:extracellular solute-binding protein [uncultured Pseudokineococcus sp.]